MDKEQNLNLKDLFFPNVFYGTHCVYICVYSCIIYMYVRI